MKKILLSLAVLAFSCVGAFAIEDTEVTFTLNDPDAIQALGIALPEAGQGTKVEKITKGEVVIDVTSGSTDSRIYQGSGGNAGKYDFRIYKSGGSLTFSAGNYSVKKIEFTGNNLGNLSAEGYSDGTWAGAAASVTLTATATTTIYTIKVTYGEVTADAILPPKFSVSAGTYFEPQTVALTCETEGAKILYTIPAGNDPEYTDDENYTGVFYDGNPLTISKTTTIKAMAVKDGKTSDIVSATYTIVNVENPGTAESPFTVADALALIESLSDGGTTTTVYYVKGIVVGAPDFQRKGDNSLYGNVNFEIADEAGGTTTLTIYRAKDLENANFTEETINRFKEGDEVVLQGKLQKYVKNEVVTPELTSGYLVSVKDTATGIANIKAASIKSAIFNAAGQLLSAPQKGLNIIDGKKVFVK